MEDSFIHYTQSTNYARYMELLGWRVLSEKEGYVYLSRIPLWGRQIVKIPRLSIRDSLKLVEKIEKKEKLFLVKLEPKEMYRENEVMKSDELRRKRFFKDKFPVLQTKTVLVDLRDSEAELFKNLRSETRHHLRKSWKENFRLEIVESDSSKESKKAEEDFYGLFEKIAKERGFYSPFSEQMRKIWESFSGKAFIFSVYGEEKKELLSGSLVLVHDKMAYYKYGASIPEGRNQYSSYFLFWEMFKWAYGKGLKFFDLEGTYDERYCRTQKYAGFTQFKRGWSRNEFWYLGSFSKYYLWREGFFR